jgi:hypothetical protein
VGKKETEGRRQDKEEGRRRTDEIPQGLIHNFRNCRDLSVKQNFPLI